MWKAVVTQMQLFAVGRNNVAKEPDAHPICKFYRKQGCTIAFQACCRRRSSMLVLECAIPSSCSSSHSLSNCYEQTLQHQLPFCNSLMIVQSYQRQLWIADVEPCCARSFLAGWLAGGCCCDFQCQCSLQAATSATFSGGWLEVFSITLRIDVALQVATSATFSAGWLEGLRMVLAKLEEPGGRLVLPSLADLHAPLSSLSLLLPTTLPAGFLGMPQLAFLDWPHDLVCVYPSFWPIDCSCASSDGL